MNYSGDYTGDSFHHLGEKRGDPESSNKDAGKPQGGGRDVRMCT